jgi:outer membrane receptor protein involved in Fe transport
LDLAIYQKVAKHARLFLEGRNVTDRSKVEREAFADGSASRREESVGRTWLAGLEVKL